MRAAVVLAAVVLTACAPPARASAAPPDRRSCTSLRGVDLAPARSIKLVRRRDDGVVRFDSCVLPRGRVRAIASAIVGLGDYSETVALRSVSGAFAVLTSTTDDQYGSSEATKIVHMRTGRTRTLASLQHQGGEPAEKDVGSTAAAVLVTTAGRVAAALLEPATGTTRIVAFTRDGQERGLDLGAVADLPPAALTLAGSTVAWINAGEPRSAPLP